MRSSENNQKKILDFIRSEIEEKGYPPSVREICVAVGLKSTSTVHAHLNNLEKKGLIRRDSTKPRALEVLDNSVSRGRNVPLVGKVTAGAWKDWLCIGSSIALFGDGDSGVTLPYGEDAACLRVIDVPLRKDDKRGTALSEAVAQRAKA